MLGEFTEVEFGEALKKLRTSKGFSARALSEKCGLSPAYISKVENGATIPSAKAFFNIVKQLELNIYEMAFLVGIFMREEGLSEGKS
jgi:hypothetical protein